MKFLFLDVETTGILPYEHSIIQIAAIVEIDNEIVDKIVLNIAPIPGSKIDPQALAVTQKTEEEIFSYPAAEKQLQVFLEFLQKYISQYDKQDKFFFLAYNAPFDVDFIRAFFVRQGNNFFGSYFWNPAIDIMVLAMEHFKKEREKLPNFKLSTVAEFANIKVDKTKLHDAYYDIILTYTLYQSLSKNSILEESKSIAEKKSTTQESLLEKDFKDSLF